MFNLSSIRYYVRSDLKAVEDLNIFQRIIFKIRLKKQLKEAIKNQLIIESLPLPDKSFMEILNAEF